MSDQATVVYGVWDHDWEDDSLLGLYSRRLDAEAHVAASKHYYPQGTRTPRFGIDEHRVLDRFPGLDRDRWYAKGWSDE